MLVEIKIDYAKCIGCEECVKACTFGVLEWFDDTLVVVNPSQLRPLFGVRKEMPSQCNNSQRKIAQKASTQSEDMEDKNYLSIFGIYL